eukprot:COSAG06_NODE_156_length_21863_cov_29.245405_22_plen_97_part_00
MRTRVQRRVVYSESAQVQLGEGRGRFRDKEIRVGAAYQAVIPVLQVGNIGEELATVAMQRDVVCKECSDKGQLYHKILTRNRTSDGFVTSNRCITR